MNLEIKKQDGITLVEVIVVIALIGIMAAIALPASWQNESTELAVEGTARELASNLQLAREGAMRDGVSYRVCFFSDSTYIIKKKDSTAGGLTPGWKDIKSGKLHEKVEIDLISLGGKSSAQTSDNIPYRYVNYARDGHTSQAGRIVLRDKASRVYKTIHLTIYGNIYYSE